MMTAQVSRCTAIARLAALLWLGASAVRAADEPVFTVLADFETDSVAISIGEVRNVPAANCAVQRGAVPARGTQSLEIAIGATTPNASLLCPLVFRIPVRFDGPQRVALFGWVNSGEVEVRVRVRDAAGRSFETQPQPVKTAGRWSRLSASLAARDLDHVAGPAPNEPPQDPLEIVGLRVSTPTVGRQVVYLDDIEVEHALPAEETLRGEFVFDAATRQYEPGATVRGELLLENRSRAKRIELAADVQWLQIDGGAVAAARATASLPASTPEFRSRQPISFAQTLTEPGLYRIVAQVRAPGWRGLATFETTVAVIPSNRSLTRGRAVFFGAGSNLLREPRADQLLEIALARELGVQLLAIQSPWDQIEPQAGQYNLRELTFVVEEIVRRDMAVAIALVSPPGWIDSPQALATREAALLEELAARFGVRVAFYQLCAPPEGLAPVDEQARLTDLQQRVAQRASAARVLSPPLTPGAGWSRGVRTEPAGLLPGGVFVTTGDAQAVPALHAEFLSRSGAAWTREQWWRHASAPVEQYGHLSDGVGLMRLLLHGSVSGVGGIIWYDLRDDAADPRLSDELRGLVRRDFSPKSALLGLASTIGMLSGTTYLATVEGAPPAFDTALFRSSTRQVAVVLPKPNRLLPALLAPQSGAAGAIDARDFLRREVPLLTLRGAEPLVLTSRLPQFVTIGFERLQERAQLQLGKPWLRVSSTLLCDGATENAIEIDIPSAARNGFLQVLLPREAVFSASIGTRRLTAGVGETVREALVLTPSSPEFDRGELTLRLSLDGRLDVPLTVRRLWQIAPLAEGAAIAAAAQRVGELVAADSGRAAGAFLHAGFADDALRVALAAPAALGVREVRLGLALEDADAHVELSAAPRSTTARGAAGVAVRSATQDGLSILEFVVPPGALSVKTFSGGQRLLLGARVLTSGGEQLVWGGGLDGSRDSAEFRWMQLRR